jgi:hypothetical protein
MDWLPPRDSNPDMLIQSPIMGSENKSLPQNSSADSSKVLQFTQPGRNQEPDSSPSEGKNNKAEAGDL